jgi:hypothetical protein
MLRTEAGSEAGVVAWVVRVQAPTASSAATATPSAKSCLRVRTGLRVLTASILLGIPLSLVRMVAANYYRRFQGGAPGRI